PDFRGRLLKIRLNEFELSVDLRDILLKTCAVHRHFDDKPFDLICHVTHLFSGKIKKPRLGTLNKLFCYYLTGINFAGAFDSMVSVAISPTTYSGTPPSPRIVFTFKSPSIPYTTKLLPLPT